MTGDEEQPRSLAQVVIFAIPALVVGAALVWWLRQGDPPPPREAVEAILGLRAVDAGAPDAPPGASDASRDARP